MKTLRGFSLCSGCPWIDIKAILWYDMGPPQAQIQPSRQPFVLLEAKAHAVIRGALMQNPDWYVTQDGGVFYVTTLPDAFDNEEYSIYEFGSCYDSELDVADGDMAGAEYARRWFSANIVPAGTKVIWK